MPSSQKIILASTSPARKELLEQIGLTFSTEASDYEEDLSLPVPPTELVQILAQGKAQAVAARHDDAIIIGADQVAVLDDEVLGKPKDAADARRMLTKLSGTAHALTTGFTIIDTASEREVNQAAQTEVHFRNLTDDEIGDYVATGEPMGHAGAYAIQKRGALLIDKIEGEYSNVMGLPLAQLAATLKEFNINVLGHQKVR